MKPYVIRQGDYVQSVASQFGFDADTVWNDAKNAELKQLRGNPNILLPGDILYVPEQDPTTHSVPAGTTSSFVSSDATVPVTVKFSVASLASQAVTVVELPDLTGLTTGGDGTLTVSVPVSLDAATVQFTSTGATYVVKIGHLDPIGTLSGVFQRLQNLGYIPRDAALDATDVDVEYLRDHLRVFKEAQSGAPDSSPSPDAAPASAPPASAPPASAPPASDATPASGPASTSAPPASGDPSQADAAPQDDAGLSDDGTLDAATSAMLLAAHGS